MVYFPLATKLCFLFTLIFAFTACIKKSFSFIHIVLIWRWRPDQTTGHSKRSRGTYILFLKWRKVKRPWWLGFIYFKVTILLGTGEMAQQVDACHTSLGMEFNPWNLCKGGRTEMTPQKLSSNFQNTVLCHGMYKHTHTQWLFYKNVLSIIWSESSNLGSLEVAHVIDKHLKKGTQSHYHSITAQHAPLWLGSSCSQEQEQGWKMKRHSFSQHRGHVLNKLRRQVNQGSQEEEDM